MRSRLLILLVLSVTACAHKAPRNAIRMQADVEPPAANRQLVERLPAEPAPLVLPDAAMQLDRQQKQAQPTPPPLPEEPRPPSSL